MSRMAHSHSLRKGRYNQPGGVYHITFNTWERKNYFAQLAAGRCVVKALMAVKHQAKTFCYTVMPDHVHWLVQLGDDLNLSLATLVQKVKSLATKAMRRLGLLGNAPLWQKGFYDHAIRKNENLLEVARYIVANPLRAGLVASIGEYPLWDADWL